MNINKSWFTFHRDDAPNWPCPTCGGASLNLKTEELRVYDSAETAHSKGEYWFEADYVRYRFSATLNCSNHRCNEVIAAVGSGEVLTEHTHDHDGGWDVVYRDIFTPHFFEPCLIPILVPESTPIDVKNALNSAFAIIFANRDATANQLRVSIEVLLDELGVQAQDKNGEFLKLGVRINNHLTGDLLKYKDRLSAIQWIGNDGSHGNGSISLDDLLAGLEIIESILVALYPSSAQDLDELARKMIEKKRPKKTGASNNFKEKAENQQ